MKLLSAFLFFLPFVAFSTAPHVKDLATYEIVIYGGSAAGVVSAIQAARLSRSVVLVVPGKHVGGMTSSGLSCVDATNPSIIGGIASEFFNRVWHYYQHACHWVWEGPHKIEGQVKNWPKHDERMWVLEPHVAESIFMEMLSENSVPVVFNERIDRKNGVLKKAHTIVQIRMESGRTFAGKMFIDATYEGDLMAASGVSYRIGRESNALYHEKDNGIKPNKPLYSKIDPYRIPGDASSGLLPRVFANLGGKIGEGDSGIQAYNYRLCLTDNPLNRIPIKKPSNYDASNYELLFRAAEAAKRPTFFLKLTHLPNKKYDANHSGPVSTDYVGKSWEYAEADYATRDRIAYEHQMWQRGLIWTLQNHPRIPPSIRKAYENIGLAKDEFLDNNHWPYELYVREGRRMVSNFVITENVVLGKEKFPADSVGLASYHMDSHAVKYYVDQQGLLQLEGGIFKKVPKPFPISYRAITPKPKECNNLLVPVCLSASHVAYGSIRMEPVFMILGQSAATAASLALQLHLPIQELPYHILRIRLLADRQIL
jgi:hypothetical protein